EQVRAGLEAAEIRCQVDTRAESLKKKVREAQLTYVPLIITIGDKEKASSTLSVRTLDGTVKMGLSMADLLEPVGRHIDQRRLDSDFFA
ncbi:MAG TPA: His/Gly/Thr/Pro-type tRNA ligase C-terminal domain-containing protein, partial [Desulfobacteraceae bacterium]|nr:His/Gly/Thr/Pro-type tRNA ligase C-terminal domain-containing protein [Desulfobacteraceae bacterium]